LVVATAALCAALAACGGSGVSNGAVVVRVGNLSITKAAVNHWAAVIEHKGAFSGFRGEPHGSARRRALALLISSHWLIDEAAREGIPVPAGTIGEALTERERASAGFLAHLHATGQTLADVKLEIGAELAAETIREQLAADAGEVTRRQLDEFFRQHRAQFDKPEERIVDLVENLPSEAAAKALVQRAGTGRQFARLAYHERVTRTPGFMRTPEKVKVVDAIFAARPGVVSEPMMLNHHWSVFVLRSTVPAKPQPLSAVRTEVLRFLAVSRQREFASKFDAEYVARWRAKTACRSGFLGPGCPQVEGQLGRYEDPFSLRAHPVLAEDAIATVTG
jgi:foldase protein PrsA